MAMPQGLGVIDLMMNIPGADNSHWYDFMKPLLLDQESREQFSMPAQYMFKDIPKVEGKEDYIAWTVSQMDRYGIARAERSGGERDRAGHCGRSVFWRHRSHRLGRVRHASQRGRKRSR
jgi:hypothetical protein